MILGICEVAEKKQGAHVGMQWRQHVVIDLTGEWDTAAEAAEAEEDGLEE